MSRRFFRARTSGITVGPTLVDLGLSSVAWDLNAAAGAVLATMTGKAAGSSVTITPNDGRIVMSSDSTQILRGLSAWTAGPISVLPTETNGTSPNSPHPTSAPIVATVAALTLQNLFPAAGFVGTSDISGFGAGNPFTATSGTVSEPTPSVPRTISAAPKPSLTYHEDPREVMNADYPATASSFAKTGVAKVRFILNGNFVDVTQMTPRTRHDWDNQDHIEWGYHVNLQHASWPADGWGRLYIISYPVDGTMLPRCIGPFLIKRKTGPYYDHTYQIGGSTPDFAATATGFNSAINTAGTACKSIASGGSGYDHVKIAIKASFTYDVINISNLFFTFANKGHLDIICDSGVNLLFNKASQGTFPLGFDFEGTRFGPGVRIDMHYISVLYAAYSGTTDQATNRKPPTLMGCEVFDSGGRFNKTGWYGYDAEAFPKADTVICLGARLLGVNWHDMYLGPKQCQLIRNSAINDISQDALNAIASAQNFGDPINAIQYQMLLNTSLTGFDLTYWDTDTPSMVFTNTSGATITVDVNDSGPNNEGNRQLIWRRNGTIITGVPVIVAGGAGQGTVTGGQGAPGSSWAPPAGGAYMPSDYIALFNAKAASDGVGTGLNGVSVALHSDPRANTIPMGYAGEASNAWLDHGPVTITATPYTMVTRYDVHGDLFQAEISPFLNGQFENIIYLNFDARMHSGQGWFWSGPRSYDCACVNTSVSYYGNKQVGHNSLGGELSHFLFWHNDIMDDDLRIPTDFAADSYCSLSNNIVQTMAWDTPPPSNTLEMDHNIYVDLAAPPGGTLNTNSTVLNRGHNGSMTDLFVDYINADYRPAGPTLSHLAAPRVPFDRKGLARSATASAVGCDIVSAGG